MKKIILIMFVLLPLTICAQWQTKKFVDDFGDETNESYKLLRVFGTFSNNYVTNKYSRIDIIIKNDEEYTNDSFYIDVYEYNDKRMAVGYENTLSTFKIKKPNGEVVEFLMEFKSKGYLTHGKYGIDKFLENVKEKGEYNIVFKRFLGNVPSVYKYKFTIN
jgi:hypothetical protein